ncbi:MAG: CPBP family intramembrane metalloprotease [Treponemataceae bacterium]|nr:CPBP family intramembrane metalloprotease [Treponemataceae bacterium]
MEIRYPGIKQTIGMLALIVLFQAIGGTVLSILARILHVGLDATLIGGLANIFAFGFFILRSGKFIKEPFTQRYSLTSFDWRYLAIGSILMVGLSIVLSEVDNLTRVVLPMPEFFQNIYGSLFQSEGGFFSSFFTLCIVAPITEELFFRGLVLPGFLSRMTKTKAILLSALLFSLIHLSPWQLIGPFIIGIIFAIIYIETRSLLPTILLHSLFNFLPLLVMAILKINIPGYSVSDYSMVEFQPLWFDLLGLFLVGIALVLYRFFLAPKAANSSSDSMGSPNVENVVSPMGKGDAPIFSNEE